MVTQQPILFVAQDSASASATEYMAINARNESWNATIGNRTAIMPADGTFKKMNIKLDTAPGTGNTWTFSITVNGTASTSVTGDIANTDTTLTIIADQTISQGDLISLECIPTSTPTTFSRIDGNIIWEPDIDDEYLILMVNQSSPSNTAQQFIYPESSLDSWNGNANNRRQLCAAAGTLKKLTAKLATDPTPGNYDVHIRDSNGGSLANSSVTVNLTNTTFASDNTNTQTIAAGDQFQYGSTPNSSPATSNLICSMVFVPDTTGEIIIPAGTSDTLSNSATEFNFIGAPLTWNSTRILRNLEIVGETITVKNHYALLSGTPGTGTSYDFQIEKNATAVAALDINLQDSETADNVVDQSVDFDDGDLINYASTPNSTPTARDVYYGIMFTFGAAPPANTLRSFVPMVVS